MIIDDIIIRYFNIKFNVDNDCGTKNWINTIMQKNVNALVNVFWLMNVDITHDYSLVKLMSLYGYWKLFEINKFN